MLQQIQSPFAIEMQLGLKQHGVVNLISHRQLCRNSLYSSTRVVFKIVWVPKFAVHHIIIIIYG